MNSSQSSSRSVGVDYWWLIWAIPALLTLHLLVAPSDQRLALRNMTKRELRSLFELSQKLRPQDADRF